MRLRPATIDDFEILCFWDTQQHVIDSDPNDDWNWEIELRKTPSWREQLIAEINEEPIGCIQIIDPKLEETHYWGNVEANLRAIDIWIGEEKNLNKGYGAQMMELTFEKCFKPSNVKAILIDPLVSNEKAHRFYERMGFEFLEKRTFHGEECKVYHLTRSNWQNRINIKK